MKLCILASTPASVNTGMLHLNCFKRLMNIKALFNSFRAQLVKLTHRIHSESSSVKLKASILNPVFLDKGGQAKLPLTVAHYSAKLFALFTKQWRNVIVPSYVYRPTRIDILICIHLIVRLSNISERAGLSKESNR